MTDEGESLGHYHLQQGQQSTVSYHCSESHAHKLFKASVEPAHLSREDGTVIASTDAQFPEGENCYVILSKAASADGMIIAYQGSAMGGIPEPSNTPQPKPTPPGKLWSREELLSTFGQPIKERATISRTHGAASFSVEVDVDTEGAMRYMDFCCYPDHQRDLERWRQLQDRFRSLCEEASDPNRSIEVSNQVSEIMNQMHDALGISCTAAAWVRRGQPQEWGLIRVCARHGALGFVQRFPPTTHTNS